MTKAEQEAFEKWINKTYGKMHGYKKQAKRLHEYAFLAGYRAGFEAQHYDIEDVSKEKVE